MSVIVDMEHSPSFRQGESEQGVIWQIKPEYPSFQDYFFVNSEPRHSMVIEK